MLSFVIPVRHPDNADNWRKLKENLNQTVGSIARQDDDRWRAVIVANHGADLPELPARFEVARVNLPPNRLYRQGGAEKEAFYEAVRSDKGRRVLAGMLHLGVAGHYMVVDDDDLVSRRLASFVAAHTGENGWFVRDGYVWSDGGALLYLHSDFSRLCGTSHIVRADLLALPASYEAVDETYIRRMLGSHVFIHDDLDASGSPLAPLPFVGAVYRTGHAGAHSRSKGILEQFFLHKSVLLQPKALADRLSRTRLRTSSINEEFFGA